MVDKISMTKRYIESNNVKKFVDKLSESSNISYRAILMLLESVYLETFTRLSKEYDDQTIVEHLFCMVSKEATYTCEKLVKNWSLMISSGENRSV